MKIIYNIWDSGILNQFGTLYFETQDPDTGKSKYLWNRNMSIKLNGVTS
jgi:hypothetical protein